MTPKIFIGFMALLLSELCYAEQNAEKSREILDGLWRNQDQPVWIKITQDENRLGGIVHKADNNPDAIGRTILRDLSRQGDTWQGEIFVARLGEFKKASLELLDENTLEVTVKLGFMSRSAQWRRIMEEKSKQEE